MSSIYNVSTMKHPWFVVLTSLLCLLVTGCDLKQSQEGKDNDAQVETLRQEGFPVTLAELNDWYATVPADENAAVIYEQAFAALVKMDSKSPLFLKKNEKTLKLLHQAATRNSCRYSVDLNDGTLTKLAHIAKFSACAELLERESISHVLWKKPDLAVRSVLDCLHLAQSIKDEPLLISYLVRLKVEMISRRALEQVMTQSTLSETQLNALSEAFLEAEKTVSLERGMVGERCMGIVFAQSSPEEQREILSRGQKGEIDEAIYNAMFGEVDRDEDFAQYLSCLEEMLTITRMPFPQCLEAMKPLSARVNRLKNEGYAYSRLWLSSILSVKSSYPSGVMGRCAEAKARLHTTQAVLAIERYRLKNRRALPSSLKALVPTFLESVPLDPFDGQPLRFKKLSGRGYVVYSIGMDRRDNGGLQSRRTSRPPDITFAVRR